MLFRRRKHFILLFLLCISLISFKAYSQPQITWNTVTAVDSQFASIQNIGHDVIQTPDGGYITCGLINFTTTGLDLYGRLRTTDAFVIKYNKQGAIEWKNHYGGAGEELASSIINTPDGGYLFVGRTYSYDGDVKSKKNRKFYDPDVWVVKLNSNGIIEWEKCYGGSFNDWANAVISTNDGGYYFTGITYSKDGDIQSTNPVIQAGCVWTVKIDANGNIIWQSCLGGALWEEGISLDVTSDGGVIINGYTDSVDGIVQGYHGNRDMWVLKLDNKGQLEWQRCLGGSRPEIGTSVVQSPDGGYLLGGETTSTDGDISSKHNGHNLDAWIVKLRADGTIEWEKTFGGTNHDGCYSIANDPQGGYILLCYTYSSDGDITGNHGSKHNGEEDAWIVKIDPIGNLEWQKCVGGSYNERPRAIIPTEGGYVFTGFTYSTDGDVTNYTNGDVTDQNYRFVHQTWTVKLGNCGTATIMVEPVDQIVTIGQTATFTVKVNGTAPFSFQWYLNNQPIPGANKTSYTTPNLGPNDNGKQYYCIINNCSSSNISTIKAGLTVKNPPSCEENYFIKGFTNIAQTALPKDMITTSENDAIICGEIRSEEPNPSDGFIFRIDASGNKLWELSFSGYASQAVLKMAKLKDNHFIAAGYDSDKEGVITYFLVKFDLLGKVIWRKDIQFSTKETMGIRKIMEDVDGTLIMLAYSLENTLSFQDRLLYFKFDASGNLQYTNNFKPKDLTSVLYTNDAIIKDGYSYIVGTHLHNKSNLIKGILTKIDNSNGNQVWSKVYDFNGRQENFLQIFDYRNGQVCILGRNNLNGSDTSTVLVCDTSGAIVSYKYFVSGPHLQFGTGTLDMQGNVMYANSYAIDGVSVLSFVNVDLISGKTWGYNYPKQNLHQSQSKILYAGDNSLYSTGSLDWGRVLVARLNSQGKAGCELTPLSVNLGDAHTFPINTLLEANRKFFQSSNKSQPQKVDILKEDHILCKVDNICTTLNIIGNKKVCRLTDTLTLTIDRDKECIAQPVFVYDDTYFSLIGFTGNQVQFQVKKSGKSMISVSLETKCFTLADVIEITIYNTPVGLYLGKDTSLCPSNALLLNAQQGYQSYLWQNASTDSTFKVMIPGLYYVQAVDGCGNTFSDTIVVTAAKPIDFNVGPYRTKCNQDTVHLSAPLDFSNYNWSTADSYSLGTKNTLIINPPETTTYFVQAEKSPGCFAYDTVQVIVNYSPQINLGKDTSLCIGDALKLNAGNGFSRYLWDGISDGQTNSFTIVSKKGTYSVNAWDVNGCLSKDTILIKEEFVLPIIPLNKSVTLCAGTIRTLNAGSGYALYQWNTGAITPSITVNDVGLYKVQVTDYNGCTAKDSVLITKISPLPSNFLPKDIQICAYESFVLKPNEAFNKQSWSTGKTTPQITISKAGLYWLEATDANYCIGRDSILVSLKNNCISGFHVPTAFTPNGDGKNDTFHPLIFGNVKLYRFVVYNRWGEVVFKSNKIAQGWDGEFLGKLQDTNVFIWTCVYQIEGSEAKSEKGTVTLVR